jgi:hypothetical protein
VRAEGEEFTAEDAENAEKEKRINISSLPGFLSGVREIRVGVGRCQSPLQDLDSCLRRNDT